VSHGFARKGLTSTLQTGTVPWVRPSDWLSLPSVVSGDQKIVMLVAVFNTSNFLAFTCSGNYQVDWGDGAGNVSYASGVKAQKELLWSDYSASTLTSRGYRQAIVTITPQTGQNLTSVDLNQRHSTPTVAHSTSVLDMRVGGPFISTFTIGNLSNVSYRMLNWFEWVGVSALSSAVNFFSGLTGLRAMVGTEFLANATDFSSMFYNCSSLQSVPLFNTAAGTSFTSMFYNCYSLQSVPLFNTAAGTNFTSMFYNCSSLQAGALSGTRYAISYANCLLSAAALNDIYANLGTPAGGAQTITVTGNWGTATDNPSLVPSGWAVAGS